jgi:hypothetical protein
MSARKTAASENEMNGVKTRFFGGICSCFVSRETSGRKGRAGMGVRIGAAGLLKHCSDSKIRRWAEKGGWRARSVSPPAVVHFRRAARAQL